MSTHTVVIEYPEGVSQRYHADMDALGGKVVAVNFCGNRLVVEEILLEALVDCVDVMERDLKGLAAIQTELRNARAAIAKATGVTR